MNAITPNSTAGQPITTPLEGVLEKITEGLYAIKDQAPMIPASEDLGKLTKRLLVTETVVGLPRLIRWMANHEGKYDFFGVQLLQKKVFRNDTVLLEALQFAIDNGIVELYKKQNSLVPEHPVTAVRLNRADRTVQKVPYSIQ